MTMKQWGEKLDAFLKFNEQSILSGSGEVSHEVAKALAQKEYKKYRVAQDGLYQSDFDIFIQKNKKDTNS